MKPGPFSKWTVIHPFVLHQCLKTCNPVVTAVVPQAVERLSPCLAASPRVSSHSFLAIPSVSVTSCIAAHDAQTLKASATLLTLQKVIKPLFVVADCKLLQASPLSGFVFCGILPFVALPYMLSQQYVLMLTAKGMLHIPVDQGAAARHSYPCSRTVSSTNHRPHSMLLSKLQ